MVGSNQSGSGTSSSSSTSGNMNYNTPPIQVGNEVRDGDEFILITKSRQSDDFKVWSSGDKQQTSQLFRQARSQVDELTTA